MKELESIVTEAERARASGKPAALATVVSIEGSAYRLPGARMLIVDGKWVAGSISGGCLEDDVVLRAGEAIARNEALVTTYDTTSDDDIVFGVGLGCKGVITILIEPIRAPDHAADFLGFARSCLQDRIAGLAATVIRAEGPLAAKPGSRLLLRDGSVVSDITNTDLMARISSEAQALSGESSRVITIPLQRGTAQVFVERIEPPTPLLVFGAGHDAMPVVRLAKELGWHVTVIDHRPAYGSVERFPLADRVVVCTPKDVASQVTLGDDTLALVMTHNYLRDRDLLGILLHSPVQYLGLLGPRLRTDQLLADLREKGVHPTAGQLTRLYAPVGLDIGSEGPAEVALSILSEMHAVMTRHRGGHLRERKRPIHQPENTAAT
jgi:xanthine/CO dehydrogenase XdhC/CoxF family maturation factor